MKNEAVKQEERNKEHELFLLPKSCFLFTATEGSF